MRLYLKLCDSISYSLGEYVKAKEFHEKALAIIIEIGDREDGGRCHQLEGEFYERVGDKDGAKAFFEKALAVAGEIGDKHGEALNYLGLGHMFQSLGDHDKAEDYLAKALSISKENGNAELSSSAIVIFHS